MIALLRIGLFAGFFVLIGLLVGCGGGQEPAKGSRTLSVQMLSDSVPTPVGQGPYDRQVQEMYIAYYGRPADPGGLAYWSNRVAAAGGNLDAIIQEFGSSAESDELYRSLGTEGAVRALYQQQFGRAPDPEGLDYYVRNINNGTFSLVTVSANIFYGATSGSEDKRMLENKVQVANQFTEALRVDAVKLAAYAGKAAATLAPGNLAEVTSNAASVSTASSRLGALYTSLIAIASSGNNSDSAAGGSDSGSAADDSNSSGSNTGNSSGSSETALTQSQKNSAFIVNSVLIVQ